MMGKSNQPVDIEYDILAHETDAAYLVEIDGEKVWLPKLQVDLDEGDQIATMPEWLAIEKGLV